MTVSNQKVWRAVYTKPRNEKKIAERLGQQGFEVFCPVQTILRQWSDRKKKVSIPIFPSYVFLRILDSETNKVLQDPGVLNFVYWLGQPALIRDEEIVSIEAFLSEHKGKTLEILNYKPGENVEIIMGPFTGHQGKIDKIKGGKLSLFVESLGMIVRVEVNTDIIIASE